MEEVDWKPKTKIGKKVQAGEITSIDELFKRKESNILFHLIRTMGLTNIASYLGLKTNEIVQYRKCELCEILFNSTENLNTLEKAVTSGLLNWRR